MRPSLVLIDWSIVAVWLKERQFLLFQSRLGSVASLGGVYCVQLCSKHYKSEAGQTEQQQVKIWTHLNPCWESQHCVMAALSAPQTTLNLIWLLWNNLSCAKVFCFHSIQQGSSSIRATEGYFYRRWHQKNELLDRTLQQHRRWKLS